MTPRFLKITQWMKKSLTKTANIRRETVDEGRS